MITQFVWMYYVLALCLCCFYSLFSFLVMFYSYYIDVQLSHLNKDYLLTYLLTSRVNIAKIKSLHPAGSTAEHCGIHENDSNPTKSREEAMI